MIVSGYLIINANHGNSKASALFIFYIRLFLERTRRGDGMKAVEKSLKAAVAFEIFNQLERFKKACDELESTFEKEAKSHHRTDWLLLDGIYQANKQGDLPGMTKVICEYEVTFLSDDVTGKSIRLITNQYLGVLVKNSDYEAVFELYKLLSYMYRVVNDKEYRKIGSIIWIVLARLEELITPALIKPVGDYSFEDLNRVLKLSDIFGLSRHKKPSKGIVLLFKKALPVVISSGMPRDMHLYQMIDILDMLPDWAVNAKSFVEYRLINRLSTNLSTNSVQLRLERIVRLSKVRSPSKRFTKDFLKNLVLYFDVYSAMDKIFIYSNKDKLSDTASMTISESFTKWLPTSTLKDQKTLYEFGSFNLIDKEMLDQINDRTIALLYEVTPIEMIKFILGIPLDSQASLIDWMARPYGSSIFFSRSTLSDIQNYCWRCK